MMLRGRPVAVSSGAATAPNVRRWYCFFFIFYPLTTFPFLFLCFRFLLLPPLFYLSLFFSFVCFFFLPSLSFVLSLPLSLFCFFVFFFFSSASVLSSPLSSPPSSTSALGVLFIEPKAWLCTALMRSKRLVGHWCDCQGPAPPLGFW